MHLTSWAGPLLGVAGTRDGTASVEHCSPRSSIGTKFGLLQIRQRLIWRYLPPAGLDAETRTGADFALTSPLRPSATLCRPDEGPARRSEARAPRILSNSVASRLIQGWRRSSRPETARPRVCAGEQSIRHSLAKRLPFGRIRSSRGPPKREYSGKSLKRRISTKWLTDRESGPPPQDR